jgi:hypothetical protein
MPHEVLTLPTQPRMLDTGEFFSVWGPQVSGTTNRRRAPISGRPGRGLRSLSARAKSVKISRRQFLKAKGAVLTLPFLHSVSPAIAAAAEKEDAPTREEGPEKKLVIIYVPNGLVRRCFFPGEENGKLPGFVGNFDADRFKDERRIQNTPGIYSLELTSSMQPLADHTKDVTLLTGLDRTYKRGQDVHAQGASCYLTSLSPVEAAERGIRHPNGRSLDHVIGEKVGRSTIFKTLEISCNAFKAGKESIYFDNISWYGPGRIAPSIKDPKKLYNRLFMTDSYRVHLNDVTELVLADVKSLSRELGRDDRHTLDEFMGTIRDIEVRIAKLENMIADAGFEEPTDAVLPRGEYIRLQADLMLLALQMGITNVCTFMIGPERWESPLRYESVFPNPVNHHSMSHDQKGDGYKELQKIDIFHMQQFSYILSRMKAIKESDGSSLLDNSLVTYGAGLGDGATHQYFDLPLIVAGHGQGQIKQGRFIQCKSGTLNSNLWLSLAKLMGLEIDQYADSTGVLSDLWT